MTNKITTYSFCDSFKSKLTDYIDEHYIRGEKDLSKLAIVFAGKRPSLYIKKELSNRIKKSFVPPKFFSIDQFVKEILRRKEVFSVAFDMDHYFDLYKIAKKETPEILNKRESFAAFLPWAKEILSFIDNLDVEDIADKGLRNIQANAEIGYEVSEDINDLLKKIALLRNTYHEQMVSSKVYSRGMQYLRASDIGGAVSFDDFDEILFCNFFYFNKTEEKIVKYLVDSGKAKLIFQGDQRKWPVLDRISKRFDCPIIEGRQPDDTTFNLELYSAYDVHTQVCFVREILKKIDKSEQTVIVLPDAEHMIPLISEISGIVEDFNVSMGYPLKRSSLYTLLELTFKSQTSRNADRYYSKDYLRVIRHPFVKDINLQENPLIAKTIVYKIEEILKGKETSDISGSIFIDLDDIEKSQEVLDAIEMSLIQSGINISIESIKQVINTIHNIFFRVFENANTFGSFAASVGDMMDFVVRMSPLKEYPLNSVIAEKVYEIRESFLSAKFINEVFTKEEIFKIFDDKISSEVVSFSGSPLKGLQILGLLETRSLDFHNVIFMDVNEGVLPKLKRSEPLIPREVKITLGLDGLELEEEMQRYQFMRLISAAKNVFLVYQENKEKERSRFVEELIWENQKRNDGKSTLSIVHSKFPVNIRASKTSFEKTPEMIEFLKNHVYSASSINTYLRDPIDFYYRYVLGIKEQDDLLDEPDARNIGIFIHGLLEESFRPFIGIKPIIDNEFAKNLFKLFDKKFKDHFEKSMKSDSFLIRAVLEDRLRRFLDNEVNAVTRRVEKIMFLEQRFDDVIRFSSGNVRFRYIIDRIDKMSDGSTMIIDYKTGGSDKMPSDISRIGSMQLSRESIFENIGSFQMPLYFHYMINTFKGGKVNCALYNLRTMEVKKFITEKNKYEFEDIDNTFMRVLDFIVAEILDINVPFIEG